MFETTYLVHGISGQSFTERVMKALFIFPLSAV